MWKFKFDLTKDTDNGLARRIQKVKAPGFQNPIWMKLYLWWPLADNIAFLITYLINLELRSWQKDTKTLPKIPEIWYQRKTSERFKYSKPQSRSNWRWALYLLCLWCCLRVGKQLLERWRKFSFTATFTYKSGVFTVFSRYRKHRIFRLQVIFCSLFDKINLLIYFFDL